MFFCLNFVIKGFPGGVSPSGGVPGYSGVSLGCSGSGPRLFLLLQTPHVSRYHELNLLSRAVSRVWLVNT